MNTGETVSLTRWLALKDRQVVVRYLQDDERHRRTILMTDGIAPQARRRLALDQFVPDRRVPFGPLVPAAQPHRLGGVIMSVVIVAVSIAQLDLTNVLAQIADPVANFLRIVFAGRLQRNDPRCGTRKRAATA